MAAAEGSDHASRRRPRLVYIDTTTRRHNRDVHERNQQNKQRVERLSWRSILRETCANRMGIIVFFVLSLVFFRLMTAKMVVSFFDPDEYWQAMEVAHKISFGYGHLTWEWEQQIRSFLHPLLFASLYTLLAKMGLDTPWLVQWTPRFLESLILVAQDIGVYLLALRMFPKRNRYNIATWSLTFQVILWFNSYCGVRTYSNCLESCLILWGLLFWPFPDQPAVSIASRKISTHPIQTRSTTKHMIISLFFAGFSVAVRPTAAIFWISMAFSFLMESKYSRALFLGITFIMACVWICILVTVDRIMYGSWVFVPWNFVKFNVLRGVGSYYGTHPVHWYFTNALPVVLFTLLPIFLYGCLKIIQQHISWRNEKVHQRHGSGGGTLLLSTIRYILIFSMLGHKEFRFLFPVVPMIMVICGYGAHCFYKPDRPGSGNAIPAWKTGLILILLLANIPMLSYFSVGHQVGTTRVLEHIQSDQSVESVYFLLPCHQTPYYSFIHRNISLDFPDCSPPVGEDPSLLGYKTENSEFLRDPASFVSIMFEGSTAPPWLANHSLFPKELPSHFVTYDKLSEHLKPFFHTHAYEECERFFHSFTPLDDIQSDVLLYCRIGSHNKF